MIFIYNMYTVCIYIILILFVHDFSIYRHDKIYFFFISVSTTHYFTKRKKKSNLSRTKCVGNNKTIDIRIIIKYVPKSVLPFAGAFQMVRFYYLSYNRSQAKQFQSNIKSNRGRLVSQSFFRLPINSNSSARRATRRNRRKHKDNDCDTKKNCSGFRNYI